MHSLAARAGEDVVHVMNDKQKLIFSFKSIVAGIPKTMSHTHKWADRAGHVAASLADPQTLQVASAACT